MIIKIDVREPDLLQQINHLTSTIPIFKNLTIKSEALPIGDIIIADNSKEKLIIERKSVSDLLASIKDGRYEEQSYRLNGLEQHNHNIIYLIEGDVSKVNRFKGDNRTEKLTLYSAMFSLNYYKGFSVFRSFSLEETAIMICNMAYKLEKECGTKQAFYANFTSKIVVPEPVVAEEKTIVINECENNANIEAKLDESLEQSDKSLEQSDKSLEQSDKSLEQSDKSLEQSDKSLEQSDKDYIGVIKKVKKDNITADNIDEIMLCQIPGISSVSAIAIIQKFKSLANLIKEIDTNGDCLNDVAYTNSKGQTRKINKTCATNIIKFLLKK
jgi:ERCC4-type nuclease